MSFNHGDKVIINTGKDYELGLYLFIWNEAEDTSIIEMHSGPYKNHPGSGPCQIYPNNEIFPYTDELAADMKRKYRKEKLFDPNHVRIKQPI